MLCLCWEQAFGFFFLFSTTVGLLPLFGEKMKKFACEKLLLQFHLFSLFCTLGRIFCAPIKVLTQNIIYIHSKLCPLAQVIVHYFLFISFAQNFFLLFNWPSIGVNIRIDSNCCIFLTFL